MLKENSLLFNFSSLSSLALTDVFSNLVRSSSIRLDVIIDDSHVILTDLKKVKPSPLPIFTELCHPNLVLFLSEIKIKAALTLFAWIQSSARMPDKLGKYT